MPQYSVVWRGSVTAEWNQLLGFQYDGKPYLLFTRDGDGAVHVDRVDFQAGSFGDPLHAAYKRKGDSHIRGASFQFQGKDDKAPRPYLFGLNTKTHIATVDQINAGVSGSSELWPEDKSKPWIGYTPDSFQAFSLHGVPHLLTFSVGHDEYRIYRFDPYPMRAVAFASFPREADVIAAVPVQIGEQAFILKQLMSPAAAATLSYRFDQIVSAPTASHVAEIKAFGKLSDSVPHGGVATLAPTKMIPFQAGGASYVLHYIPYDGWARFTKFSNDGKHASVVLNGQFKSGWTDIVPFTLDGHAYFAFYKFGAGDLTFLRFDP